MAQRIVSLLAAGTEILYGLGLGDSVAAISHECDFPPEALDKPRITAADVPSGLTSREIDEFVRQRTRDGRPPYCIDRELLAALRPDLIVTQSQCDVCAVSEHDVRSLIEAMPALRSTHVVALNPTSLDQVFSDVERVAEGANAVPQAKPYIAGLRNRVERIRARAETVPAEARPRVIMIEWIDPSMVAGNWMPDLIRLAGGSCGLTRSGEKSGYTTWADVVAFDPEVIVISPCGFDLTRTVSESAALAHLTGWGDLNAVQNHRVYAVDGNAYFNRSGPRLVDSLELLAHLIHPAICDDPAYGSIWKQIG